MPGASFWGGLSCEMSPTCLYIWHTKPFDSLCYIQSVHPLNGPSSCPARCCLSCHSLAPSLIHRFAILKQVFFDVFIAGILSMAWSVKLSIPVQSLVVVFLHSKEIFWYFYTKGQSSVSCINFVYFDVI